jgi:isopenicillin-N epimerase
MSTAKWKQAREQMLLDPHVANLNTGSFGPLPKSVFELVTELRRRLAKEPMDFLLRQAPPLLCDARKRLSAFLGADPRRLIFTANVTASVNTVAASLRLAAPGEILLTDHEYGAMHWCWQRAGQRQGLNVRTVALPAMPSSEREIVSAVAAAFTEQTRLFFTSHVLSPTGMVLPAQALCAEARRRGILTMIDGAHAPAMIPLDLSSLDCDFYGGNCHKWLLAPTGTGFLYVRQGSEHLIRPLQVSWGWHYDARCAEEPDEFGSTGWIRSFEFEGTRDPCAWLGVPAAIDFQEALGWTAIRERVATLTRHVRARLGDFAGLELATPPHPALHGFMTAFRLPVATSALTLRRSLWEKYAIEAPIIERPDALLVRVSTHFYNTEEEIDRLADALSALLAAS